MLENLARSLQNLRRRFSDPTMALSARRVRLRRTCALLHVPVCLGPLGLDTTTFRGSIIGPFQLIAA